MKLTKVVETPNSSASATVPMVMRHQTKTVKSLMFIKGFKVIAVFVLGWVLLSATLGWAQAEAKNAVYKADIRWTSYGVPHIKAQDERGLGYGIGYAYARDNACLLVEEALTVRGHRSRYFGIDGETSAELDNLTSDFFFSWLNDAESVNRFWRAQPEPIQQLIQGYVVGFNRYLKEADKQPMSCWGQPWIQAISKYDLIRLSRSLLVEAGLGQFAEALVAAQPPSSWWQWLLNKFSDITNDTGLNLTPTPQPWQGDLQFGIGSNAVAVGQRRSVNGKGMLLANPHFPWQGALCLYQMHLTIPGQLDVMGAALPGLPLINIGFNQHLAWTHTVDTSTHFTLYRLELDPQNYERYMVDGKSYPLTKRLIQVQLSDKNGERITQSREVYESKYGPLVTWPGMLNWNRHEAYAIKDANLNNARVLEQWYAINRAQDVLDLRNSVENIQGTPWINTIAADDKGHALYMNQSVIPNISSKQLQTCAIAELFEEDLPGLYGHSSNCDWLLDPTAAQVGIMPATQLPSLLRDDFVQNSNGSAWMTNPDQPLIGYSPMVSKEANSLKLRTRFALSRLHSAELISIEFLQSMVTDNEVYLADLVMDDLLAFCVGKTDAELLRGCKLLADWDGRAAINSGLGFMYFDAFMNYFADGDAWLLPFDPMSPLLTPKGIALNKDAVVEGITAALLKGAEQFDDWKIPYSATWGDVQGVSDGQSHIAIPGGLGDLSIYNVIESEPYPDKPYLEVHTGSSYIQLVSFNDQGPQALGLLAFSQSSDPLSKHYRDQTLLFSNNQWPVLPFSDQQIEADLELQRMELFQ